MRNLKRALSLALASVMLLGMMVVGTSAASYTDVDEKDNVEAIEVLNAVNVMIGRQGNFEPDEAVNRHEMAVIMAKLYLGSEEADNYVGSHPFTDVVSWADKYVAACYENGLVSGTSATTFSGSQPLTAIQATAMMLRALGYEKLSEGASDWRTPVAAKANQIRLFKDVVSSPNTQLNRNQVAQLALNTLKADVVTTTTGSSINLGDIGTITTEVKYETIDYTSEGSSNYAGTGSDRDGYGRQQLCEKLYGTDLKLTDTTDDFGRPAIRWAYKAKEVGKYANEADATYTAEVKAKDLYSDLSPDGENGKVAFLVAGTATTTEKAQAIEDSLKEDGVEATVTFLGGGRYRVNVAGETTDYIEDTENSATMGGVPTPKKQYDMIQEFETTDEIKAGYEELANSNTVSHNAEITPTDKAEASVAADSLVWNAIPENGSVTVPNFGTYTREKGTHYAVIPLVNGESMLYKIVFKTSEGGIVAVDGSTSMTETGFTFAEVTYKIAE